MYANHTQYYDLAAAAVSRRDYLSAMQYGVRAAGAPREQVDLRCDAQILLALISLELGDAEAALAYAVGAHLNARQANDGERSARAEAAVAMVVAHSPYLCEERDQLLH